MSVKSTNKEGAWEFIRSLLEEDYQNNYVSYFPLLRSAFDNKAAEASKAYYATDENGNQVEQATLRWKSFRQKKKKLRRLRN